MKEAAKTEDKGQPKEVADVQMKVDESKEPTSKLALGKQLLGGKLISVAIQSLFEKSLIDINFYSIK